MARLTQDTIILTSAVKLGKYWRELAEKLARLTKQQIEAYEKPHQGKNGAVALEVRLWCDSVCTLSHLHKHSQGPFLLLCFVHFIHFAVWPCYLIYKPFNVRNSYHILLVIV